MSYYLDNVIDRLTTQRNEARAERDQARAALDRLAALCAAWTELAVARGALLKAEGGSFKDYQAASARVHAAFHALIKLGVDREALS